jgi:hypothetical protein
MEQVRNRVAQYADMSKEWKGLQTLWMESNRVQRPVTPINFEFHLASIFWNCIPLFLLYLVLERLNTRMLEDDERMSCIRRLDDELVFLAEHNQMIAMQENVTNHAEDSLKQIQSLEQRLVALEQALIEEQQRSTRLEQRLIVQNRTK